MTTALGTLTSIVDTVFNPNGSATIDYYIEKFNTSFDNGGEKLVYDSVVTLNADGSYSDGGVFEGLIGSAPTAVNINLDATKLASYSIEGGVLSASVKAENTAAVLGAAIDADVSFMLTISSNRIISVVLNYATELGAVKSIISYR